MPFTLAGGPYINSVLLMTSVLSVSCMGPGCNTKMENKDPIYPSVEIRSSIAGDVMPAGYNVTLFCVGNKAEEARGPKTNAFVYSIQWFFDDKFTLKCGGDLNKDKEAIKTCSLDIIHGSAKNSGQYVCNVVTTYECSAITRSFAWKEPVFPMFTIHPRDTQSVISGSDVNLACEATGIPEASITWWKGNNELEKANITTVGGRSSLVLNNVTEEDDGAYLCVANSMLGSVKSNFSRLTVAYKPEFIIHPMSLTVGSGSATNVTLKCEARGFPEPSIEWRKNNEPLENATVVRTHNQSLLILRSTKPNKDGGKYSCVANNSVGVTYSDEAVIQEQEILNDFQIWSPPKNQTAAPGDTVAFTCSARGYPATQITWLKNGAKIRRGLTSLNAETSSLNLTNVEADDQGAYTCQVNSTGGNILESQAGYLFIQAVGHVSTPTPSQSTSVVTWSLVAGFCAAVIALLAVLLVRRKNIKKKNQPCNMQAYFVQARQPGQEGRVHFEEVEAKKEAIDAQDEKFIEHIDDWTYLKLMGIDRNWEIPRARLTVTSSVLGGGEFGVVKKGVYERRDGRKMPVAVKLLKETADQDARQALITELRILKHVGRHPNVLSLVGACTFDEPICVVTEFVSGGDLRDLLIKSRVDPLKEERTYVNIKSTLTERQLLQIAVDVSSGMRHLESKQCLHRDLAARNVLIGDKMVAKVADFGLARDISVNGHYILTSGTKVPLKWMPLEALRGFWTTKSDVWSFGVVLWEIVNLGEEPYEKVKEVLDLTKKLSEGYRLEKPRHCSEELYSIMLDCWKGLADDRPTFAEIYESLFNILNTEPRKYVNIAYAPEM